MRLFMHESERWNELYALILLFNGHILPLHYYITKSMIKEINTLKIHLRIKNIWRKSTHVNISYDRKSDKKSYVHAIHEFKHNIK